MLRGENRVAAGAGVSIFLKNGAGSSGQEEGKYLSLKGQKVKRSKGQESTDNFELKTEN
jgi:hypothetical protein